KSLNTKMQNQTTMNTKTQIISNDRPTGLIISSLLKTMLLCVTLGAAAFHFATSASAVTACDRQNMATQIRDNTRITLNMYHDSGVQDGAYARLNIIDTANGGQAQRSAYGTAPGGTTWLDPRLLNCMI